MWGGMILLFHNSGVQLLARNYNYSIHPVFTEEDVVSLYPLVSHTEVRVSIATVTQCSVYIYLNLLNFSQWKQLQYLTWLFQSTV